ncbi:MAG: pilus assembly protein [Alphaproteobacteria bacterium]|nr:pilus assembly protein [Alphaproteobacteria bacterium]
MKFCQNFKKSTKEHIKHFHEIWHENTKQPLKQFNKSKYLLKKRNIGGILIEFTICLPILILVLFFVNDHYRFYELRDKVKASAYMAASMCQNVCNNRDSKQLTITDLKRITYASCLNFFHNQTMFSPWPFGMYYSIIWIYVKRNSSNNYRYQTYITNTYSGSTPTDLNHTTTSLTTKTETEIKSIHADLVCENDGDERVMVWVYYDFNTLNMYFDKSTYVEKSNLGLFILPLKVYISEPSSFPPVVNAYFKYQVIFTPKPGRFPVSTS